MKNYFRLLFQILSVTLLPLGITAQSNAEQLLSGYLFEKFDRGEIKMKNGTQQFASLNYNIFEQSIEFQEGDHAMTITNPEDVDTIKFNHEVFIPVKGKFYALLQKGKLSLLVSYHAKAQRMVSTADHVHVGQVSQNQVSNTVTSVYTLGVKKGQETYLTVLQYWTLNGSTLERFNSEKQIAASFEQSDSVKAFMKQSKPNFGDPVSITKVFDYGCSLK